MILTPQQLIEEIQEKNSQIPIRHTWVISTTHVIRGKKERAKLKASGLIKMFHPDKHYIRITFHDYTTKGILSAKTEYLTIKEFKTLYPNSFYQ